MKSEIIAHETFGMCGGVMDIVVKKAESLMERAVDCSLQWRSGGWGSIFRVCCSL